MPGGPWSPSRAATPAKGPVLQAIATQASLSSMLFCSTFVILCTARRLCRSV